jgi:hypothetical protein
MENLSILYGHLEYLTAIWDLLVQFGIFCDHLVDREPKIWCVNQLMQLLWLLLLVVVLSLLMLL